MMRACVIGWPISHSRSPLIHNYWLKQHSVGGMYEQVSVKPEQLRNFIESLAAKGFSGCNVTQPHKAATFGLVNIADAPTERLGVVNTVYLRNGTIFGTSTDGEGFLASLAWSVPNFSIHNRRVVMIGAGGAAMAIAGALLDAGAGEIAVANRSAERVEMVRQKFGSSIAPVAWEARSEALTDCSLLVNCTSLGMTNQPPLTLDLERLPSTAVVTDIVYSPRETSLLRDAGSRGNVIVPGLGMLLHQAVRGFSLWFGVKPAVTAELYDIVADDIDRGFMP